MIFISACQNLTESPDRVKVAMAGQKPRDLDFVIRRADQVASHIAELGEVRPIANNTFDRFVGAPFDGDTLWRPVLQVRTAQEYGALE